MGTIPIPIPKAKPMDSHTHDTWVQVQMGMDMGTLKFTCGLPMLNTTHEKCDNRSQFIIWHLQRREMKKSGPKFPLQI